MNIHAMNNRSISHKMKTVSEEFLKFNKTHCGKTKQTWYHKVQILATRRRSDSMFEHLTLINFKS